MTGARWIGRAKYGLKWLVAEAMYRLGILQLLKHVLLRRRAVVLVYHRVLPSQAARDTWSHHAIVVTAETFERHMRLLRRNFKVLTLDEFGRHFAESRPFDGASCLVTFDDGWLDNYTDAWPVLRRHQIPAVVFLPVNFIGSRDVFWQERLGALLFEAARRARGDQAFAARVGAMLAPFGLAAALTYPPESARAGIQDLVRARKEELGAVAPVAIERLSALVEPTSGDPASHGFMNWAQIREMASAGVSFGGHGAAHRILTTLDAPELEQEVATARRVLDQELAEEATSFSYPNGNWNASVARAVKAARYVLAFSMGRGSVSVQDDPLSIRRVNIFEDVTRSEPMFLARVLGVF